MKSITLYTWATCPFCIRALALLDQKGAAYTNIDARAHAEAFEAVKAQTGSNTVPQIFVAGEFIGGCDALYALEARGELDAILGLERSPS